LGKTKAKEGPITVWIYINTGKEVGDVGLALHHWLSIDNLMQISPLRRKLALLNSKPIGITEVRDQIAYQALWTSRFSASVSLIAVLLSAVVAFVAISSLRLNSITADQARRSAQSQINANARLADAAARQAEASVAAAKTSQDNLIASQRAWVGPTDANITAPDAFKPLQVTVLFGNSGRQPAPTVTSITPKIFSLDEWNSGTGVQDIEKWRTECLQSPMNDQIARITFPTTGFTNFFIRYDGTQQSIRDVQKLSVSPEVVIGKAIVALKGCFVYVGQAAD
jgi:hypothetical protein